MRTATVAGSSGPDSIVLEDRATPVPGPGEVLVRPRVAALNYRDLLVASGGYGKIPAGRIPVSDAVGVDTQGRRVVASFMTGWLAGEMTPAATRTALGGAVDGVLAQEVVLPAASLVEVPDAIDDATAASLPCAGVTAWRALEGVVPGDTVLTIGSGGVSTWAIVLARARGARVLAVSRDPARRARRAALGAEVLDGTGDWDGEAYRLTGERGVDRVVELGGPGTLARSIRAVRMSGTISLIGTITGNEGAVPTANLLRKGVRLQGLLVGSRADLESLVRAVALHRLMAVIDRTFPLEQVQDAYRHLAAGGQVGKVLVTL